MAEYSVCIQLSWPVLSPKVCLNELSESWYCALSVPNASLHRDRRHSPVGKRHCVCLVGKLSTLHKLTTKTHLGDALLESVTAGVLGNPLSFFLFCLVYICTT